MVEQLRQDLSYGVRMLRKHSGFTAGAVMTLALGIGISTAVFNVVDTIVFRPLPYKDPDRLVKIWSTHRGHGREDLSLADFSDIRDRNQVFEQVAADDGTGFRVVHPSGPRESVDAALVTPNWLSVLAVEPIVGRNFMPGEEQPGRDRVVILANDYWRRRFGSDPGVIGATLTLDGEANTVIGILPPNVLRYGADILKPLVPAAYTSDRAFRDLDVFARLAPNVTLAQARADVETIARRLEQEYPATNKDRGVCLEPLGKYYANTSARGNQALVLMLGAVGLVLLIACANVANLLLARAATRRRECILRAALGASRGRIIRQLLTESMLLFLVGAALGVVLAAWSVDLLVALAVAGAYAPERMAVALDARVLVFSLLTALSTGLLFGMVPALQGSRGQPTEALTNASRAFSGELRRHRPGRVLVASEIALALILLIGFSLIGRSFVRLQGVAPGFDPKNLLAVIGATGRPFPQQIIFWQAVLDRVRSLPGVESVAVTSRPPLHRVREQRFIIEGRPLAREGERPGAGDVFVSPDYFRTMRIPVLKGRSFTERDTQTAPPVAIVSQSLARRYFGNEEPLGRRVSIEPSPKLCCGGAVEGGWREIVGVVGDVRQGDLDEEPAATLYRPYSQIIEHDMFVTVRARSSADAGALAASLGSHLSAMDRDISWTPVDSQIGYRTESLKLRRFALILFGIFALLALVLAAVGIYGVTAYSVAERTREIGIRVALGATRDLVMKQLLGETMMLALAGLIPGGLAALTLTRFISSMLFGVSATDAVTYLGVSFLLAGVALLAGYLPVRRAIRLDPIAALRHE